MNPNRDDLEHRIECLKERLHQSGHKATHQRIEVFREVLRTDEHPDAEIIFLEVRERIPTISRNTVYQTLQFLVDQGYIAPFGLHHDSHRYDRNTSPHHHFVCVRCGKVRDVVNMNVDQIDSPACAEQWGRIDSVHMEVRGVCRECLSEKEATVGETG
ncbi:MAG: transcriptional repressor [Magnetococcales bacterium]|nr:transcriptional repressor [Magnetococcales bacterium]